MKRILCNYYSSGNFGDDLFVLNLAEHFCNDMVYIIGDPNKIPSDLPKNVKHLKIVSFFIRILGFIEGKLNTRKLKNFLSNYIIGFPVRYGKKYDAVVIIGGSIFMDNNRVGGDNIPFTISRNITREYEFCSVVQNANGLFFIGVNMGPVYHSGYWEEKEKLFKECNHVCIRDYSSYYPFRHLNNVQYAPDVGFCTRVPKTEKNRNDMILITLIDIERRTKDRDEIESYYRLMAQSVKYYSSKGKKVVLVSLCSQEGDWRAIERLELQIEGVKHTTFSYCGNLHETIALFANADYIICSRFHAMIMGLLFDKPIYPICYNCKMDNYLQDLYFRGKYVKLGEIKYATLKDVDYNRNRNIITDAEKHKGYAVNQFMALDCFLHQSTCQDRKQVNR